VNKGREGEAIKSRCEQGSQVLVIMESINSQTPRRAVLILLLCRRLFRTEAKPLEKDLPGWRG